MHNICQSHPSTYKTVLIPTSIPTPNPWNLSSPPIPRDVMILLIWNCRGAASTDFFITFKDLVAFHKPQLVILSETKLAGSKVDSILSKLGFSHFIKSDVEGLSGGLAILW